MTPVQLESVTVNVLRQLDAAHPLGMKSSSLLDGLHQDDLRFVSADDLTSLLADLAEQGLVAVKASTPVPELKRFARTVQARAWLSENGF